MIADLAVNHVERLVLLCGWTLHRVIHDYGLDACLTTYSAEGEIENGVVWMQVKATDNVQLLSKSAAITVRVSRKDLLSWLGEVYPVVLVLYDASADHAYWLDVQSELQGSKIFEVARRGATITLRVAIEHRLNEQSVRDLQQLKAQRLAQW